VTRENYVFDSRMSKPRKECELGIEAMFTRQEPKAAIGDALGLGLGINLLLLFRRFGFAV